MKYFKPLFPVLLILFWSQNCQSEGITLPKPSGRYSVGTKAIEVRDRSRPPFRGNGNNKWMVQAFYPSEPHMGTYFYMPGTIKKGNVEDTQVFAHGKPNAPILKEGPYPLILFIPGLGGERQLYTILCEELASQGYVILSFDTPYVSNFVRFPNGDTLTLTLKDAWKVPRDRDYRYQYYDEAMVYVMGNVTYILDHLDHISREHFQGILLTKGIIIMGHSFGGNVAHTFGFKERRIKAIVDIDSKITERKIFGRVGVPPNPAKKPVLFIRGMMQYQEDLGNHLNNIENTTIWKPTVQHSAFSDNGYLAHKIKDFGKNYFIQDFFKWLFKTGPFWDTIDTNLGDHTVDAWFKLYRASIVSWLKKNAEENDEPTIPHLKMRKVL